MKGAAIARHIGQKRINPYHIKIATPKGTMLCDDGVRRNGISEPYMGKSIAAEYHPGGNSICYALQTAHHMGAEEMILAGFTLKSGSPYFFGTEKNPVTKRSSIYDTHRALAWLSWFEKTWPGRARLMEGWSGPVNSVLQTVTHEELNDRFCKPKAPEGWIV